jgi:competence protein ComEA
MADWVERNRGHILVILLNLAVVGALFFWMQRPAPTRFEIAPAPAPSPTMTHTMTPALLRVYVTGAVVHPDVYQLPHGSIVRDAIQVAGGATAEADLVRINLAQELHDQQQIHVPRIGESQVLPTATSSLSLSTRPVAPPDAININTASAEQLATLPGIGPALAQRIVDWRTANGPFATIADITKVPGIGDKIFERIKDQITVGG